MMQKLRNSVSFGHIFSVGRIYQSGCRSSLGMRELVEGCYFVDTSGDVYAVKGLVHPPGRVYAFPRQIGGVKVKHYLEGFKLVAEKNPIYVFDDPYLGRTVIAVPRNSIKQVIFPAKTAKGPEKLVETAHLLARVLDEMGIDFGFTGSLLLGTADEKSDIDIVVYGGEKQYRAVKQLREQGVLQPVNPEVINLLAESRTDTPKAFPAIETEQRKILTGTYAGHLYTMKIIPKTFWETWSETRITPERYFETVVEIVDDSEVFYTPARYGVKNIGEGPEIAEVVSFRSRFAEMGFRGEKLLIGGMLEKVVKRGRLYHRINVGIGVDDHILPVKNDDSQQSIRLSRP